MRSALCPSTSHALQRKSFSTSSGTKKGYRSSWCESFTCSKCCPPFSNFRCRPSQAYCEDHSPPEKLFCICSEEYDDSKWMIGCDTCDGWFHGSCIKVSESVSCPFFMFPFQPAASLCSCRPFSLSFPSCCI